MWRYKITLPTPIESQTPRYTAQLVSAAYYQCQVSVSPSNRAAPLTSGVNGGSSMPASSWAKLLEEKKCAALTNEASLPPGTAQPSLATGSFTSSCNRINSQTCCGKTSVQLGDESFCCYLFTDVRTLRAELVRVRLSILFDPALHFLPLNFLLPRPERCLHSRRVRWKQTCEVKEDNIFFHLTPHILYEVRAEMGDESRHGRWEQTWEIRADMGDESRRDRQRKWK